MNSIVSRRQFTSIVAAAGAMGAIANLMPASLAQASGSADQDSATVFTPGTYTATVRSIGGPMTVEVTLSDSAIEDVQVTEYHDSDGIIESVIAQIPEQVVEHQSLDVDSVTGATMSSFFMKQAITDAVSQGVTDTSTLENDAPFVADPQQDMDVDVVIVGGGIAGLATAATASDKGLNVVLVEKNAFLGGNALISEGQVVGSQTEPINSRFDDMTNILASYGASFHQIENENFTFSIIGFDIVDGNKSAMSTAMSILVDHAKANGATLLTNNEVQGLIIEDGSIKGVTVQPKGQDTYTIRAKAVVLSTGGFSANSDLVTQYMPQYEGIHCGGLHGPTGDALSWIKDVDGQTIMLDSDAQFYSNDPQTGSRATAGSWYPLYVDANGDMFTDSAYYTDAAHAAWNAFGNDTYYNILTDAEVESTDTRWLIDHMLEAQDCFEYSSIEDIANDYGLTNLATSAEQYGYDPEGTFYLSPCQATIYATYGGILIDEQGRVLNNSDEPIPGLYACGEVIGSQNYQQYGMYIGQLGPSLTMGMVIAESLDAELNA